MTANFDSDYIEHMKNYDTELGDDTSTPTGVTSNILSSSSSSFIESSSTGEEYYKLSETDDEGEVEIISRDQWGAFQASKPSELEVADHPLHYISFHYNSGIEPCRSIAECSERMRALQKKHTDEKYLADISYNFLVGGDLRVYEGRGWLMKPDKSLRYADLLNFRMDIAFLGDYRECVLPMKMFQTAQNLIRLGVKEGFVKEDFECVGLSDVEPRDDDIFGLGDENETTGKIKEKGKGGGGGRGRGRGSGRGRGRRRNSGGGKWRAKKGSQGLNKTTLAF